MKKLLLAGLCASVFLSPTVQAESVSQVEEARGLAKQFLGTLKPELGKAMKSGGPVHAVEICHAKAPQIAKELAESSGWEVNRVSLKPRATSAKPDAWEIEVLKRFDQEAGVGTNPMGIEFAEMVEEDGQKTFRYMKAIPTGGVCLTCHGDQVSPAVKEAIKTYYPEDLATGYQKGELRGAFSFKKVIYPALGVTSFKDQWDKPQSITKQTQWLVFSKTKDAGNWVKDSFNALGYQDLAAKNLIYIADLSGMPSLITKWFAIPKMKDYAFPIALVYDEKATENWPYAEDAAMVYQLKKGEIVKVHQFKDPVALQAFLKQSL